MPVGSTIVKGIVEGIMPKPKEEKDQEMEYGIYLNSDGTYWQMDSTGFHPYISKDPVYSQDASGVWWVTDTGGKRLYVFPEPKYFQDENLNYWVDYGDGRGYVKYIPEMERLQNGFYQDTSLDYWEQSDAGLNRYTPLMEPLPNGYYLNSEDGLYWIKDDAGFREFKE